MNKPRSNHQKHDRASSRKGKTTPAARSRRERRAIRQSAASNGHPQMARIQQRTGRLESVVTGLLQQPPAVSATPRNWNAAPDWEVTAAHLKKGAAKATLNSRTDRNGKLKVYSHEPDVIAGVARRIK